MSLWWLQPGWDQARCPNCGKRIWPEGDPDWGACYECFTAQLADREREQYEAQSEADYYAQLEAEQAANAPAPEPSR
jgi:hypothetical protein